MRGHIFCFQQKVALKFNLNLTELLVLDYLINFLDSNKQLIRNIGGKKFAWIAYKKVAEDLPILSSTFSSANTISLLSPVIKESSSSISSSLSNDSLNS